MRAEHRGLADLAASVADGSPIDWTEVESRTSPADQRLLSHLRLVESIASLHRSIPTEAAGEDEGRCLDPLVGQWPDDAAARAAGSDARWGRLSLLERIGEDVVRGLPRLGYLAPSRSGAQAAARGRSSGEARTRILDEARRLARIRHQHVVQVYGAEQHDRRVGLWMELVRGESLSTRSTSTEHWARAKRR